jgi:hypothetical protein
VRCSGLATRKRASPAFSLDRLVAGVAPLPCPPAVGHVARFVDGRNCMWSVSGSRTVRLPSRCGVRVGVRHPRRRPAPTVKANNAALVAGPLAGSAPSAWLSCGKCLIGEIDKKSRAMTRAFRAIFINCILLSSFATRVAAGPLEDATAATERRDYATTLRLLRPLSDQGKR